MLSSLRLSQRLSPLTPTRTVTVYLGAIVTLTGLINPATAQQSAPKLEGWFDLNTFAPPSTPKDGIGLENAQVLESLQLGVGALLQVDDDPLTWQRENERSFDETAVAIEHLVALHTVAALGLFDVGQLAVRLPIYLDEGTPGSSGEIGDLGICPKLAVRRESEAGRDMGLGIQIPVFVPIGNEQDFVGQGRFSIAPGLVGDFRTGRFRAAMNATFLYRKEETRQELTRGSEVRIGLGAQFALLQRADALRALIEISVASQTAEFLSRAATPVTATAGLAYHFKIGLSFMGALGTGLSAGVGAPDVRTIIGLGYISPSKTAGPEQVVKADADKYDTDHDGIVDIKDQCKTVSEDFDNFEDDDGCPELDNDKDGIVDLKDMCPVAAENIDGIDDEDGCPEADTDGDGVQDSIDDCPDSLEDRDGYEDRDGCPDPDNDLDGVMDLEDRCPNLPESAEVATEPDGCPDSFEVVENALLLKRPIRFHRGTADFTDASFEILEEIGHAIAINPDWGEILITVHTSGRGRSGVQQRRSEQRAAEIVKFLINLGISPDRLVADGRGNQAPLAPADSPEGRRKNERVEFELSEESVQ